MTKMDHAACNIIYVNRRAKEQTLQRTSYSESDLTLPNGVESDSSRVDREVRETIESILSTFTTVHVYSSGSSCLSKICDLDNVARANAPTLVLIDIPHDDEHRPNRLSREYSFPPTVIRAQTTDEDSADIHGSRLLSHIASEIYVRKLSKLIIPVAMISSSSRRNPASLSKAAPVQGSQGIDQSGLLVKYMDAGAADVVICPVTKDRVQGLATHAYRVFKEVTKGESTFLATKRSRKMSWVGVDDKKPFAYLRESMVSNLMSGICSPETDLTPDLAEITSNGSGNSYAEWEHTLSSDRKSKVAAAVGKWSFSAHDYTDDELIYGAICMLQHALTIEELAKWKQSTDEIFIFMQACRVSYNEFVHYHNFRHVIDVLQALFFFLVQLGTLPPYLGNNVPNPSRNSVVASIIQPFDALVLLISAVGHDVGHPGVNNAFLVSLNAPLAQLYNDRSVLESFHCAAYSQILRRHWPSVFKDTSMRRLMINSILATDMGLHFKYMGDLSTFQKAIEKDPLVPQKLTDKSREEYRDLLCGLLIKCADISNVAREFPVAHQWANILTEEFANQGEMEKELDIPSALFGGPPTIGDIVKLGESQQGFMGLFARPLFEAVTGILPVMSFSIDELERNKQIWDKKIADEKSLQSCKCDNSANCDCSTSRDSFTESLQTNEKSTPHTSTDAAELRSQSISSSNGQVSLSPTSITATALPLQQIVEQLFPEGTDAASRGRATKTSTSGKTEPLTSQSDSKLLQKTAAPVDKQRAVSAHHPTRKQTHHSDPMPNGLNSNFAASETDVRYLGNGGATLSGKGNNKDVYLLQNGDHGPNNHDRKEKKLAHGFKRLFKKRWRSGASVSSPKLEAQTAQMESPTTSAT